MFRGKESSNRIKLSRLVQDLLNFSVLGSLRLWGEGWLGWLGGWGGGWLGCPTHVHMHVYPCTCMDTHAHVVNMIISCKWLPPLGKSLGIPYDTICVYVCVHMCACTCMCVCGGVPSHHPPLTSTQPPTPQGDPGISQNSIALELIEIFQLHLKI